jgi:peptidyl-dipeptidase Dcp
MKKQLIAAAALAMMSGAAIASNQTTVRENPFLQQYTTPYEIPPFEQIEYADYMPALRAAIAEHDKEIAAIVSNKATATFDNTILALDRAGRTLDKVVMVYYALTESNSSPELQKISEEFEPLVAAHSDEVSMNAALFKRVKYVYDNREKMKLAADQKLFVENLYKNFTRNGALLNDADQSAVKALNGELTDLYLQFNKNLLAATNAFELVIDNVDDLAGLPQSNIDVAAEEAAARGYNGKWVLTLHSPCRLPVLQYADNRELREKIYKAYTTLASSGQYDNRPVINKILQARAKKAKLLGFENFGAYMTDNVMAHTVEKAEDLLMQIWGPAVQREKEEVAEMQAIADREGKGVKIAPWDYYYYNEKVRKDKYALDEAEVRNYFSVDNVRKGIFTMAERLYGIKFTEMPDAPKYYDEVKVYNVTDATTGEHIAVFMTDYFPRASKRQGAWMSEFKGSWENADGTSSRPIIYNVGNFSKPTATTPSLLTIDEVETMFHEFGHGLHGMLSKARYKNQAGTNVDRDFVELPSQMHEHWAFEPELLKEYAYHWQTGELIPDELVKKLEAASSHNMGFRTTELAGAALLDLQYGKLNPTGDIDINEFEKQVGDKLGMPAELTYRYRSTYFKHIFGSNEYASGYYTYLWAEVLDCDAFELFKEKGIFDKETANSFKQNVLQAGGSVDPMQTFVKFRGHQPSVNGLLRNRGLLKDDDVKINKPKRD